MGAQLSWLEYLTDIQEVLGSIPRAPTKKKVMKEYKIWKFNKSGYLQTVTVSLEEEYPCKQKRCGYSCLGDKTKHVKILYILDFYIEFLQMDNYKKEYNPQEELII